MESITKHLLGTSPVSSNTRQAAGSQFNKSPPIMDIHTSLYTWYPLLNEKYLNVLKVFSVSIGTAVVKGILISLTAISFS